MPEQGLDEQIVPPIAKFYNISFDGEDYEVEAYSEEHAFQRVMAVYQAMQAELGNTVIVTKLGGL